MYQRNHNNENCELVSQGEANSLQSFVYNYNFIQPYGEKTESGRPNWAKFI
jgi:hypothetical protein